MFHFRHFLLPFSFFLFLSYSVFFSLSESRLVFFRPVPVSTGLALVLPGLPRPPLEDLPKKEKPTRSYTFRSEKCNMELALKLERGRK